MAVYYCESVTWEYGTDITYEQHGGEDDLSEIKIALIGKTGVGKSAVGNTILGRKAFVSSLSPASVTKKCKKKTGSVSGQAVAVVDTPGLFDTDRDMEEVKAEVRELLSLAPPGPHVFLIVIEPTRFTEEQQKTLAIIQEIFGEEARKFSMVLFTHGDALEAEGVAIESLIRRNPRLRDFVSQCGGGYHVFNNRDKENRAQVRRLKRKIMKLVQDNGGRCYSTAMFDDYSRAMVEYLERVDEWHSSFQRHMADVNTAFSNMFY